MKFQDKLVESCSGSWATFHKQLSESYDQLSFSQAVYRFLFHCTLDKPGGLKKHVSVTCERCLYLLGFLLICFFGNYIDSSHYDVSCLSPCCVLYCKHIFHNNPIFLFMYNMPLNSIYDAIQCKNVMKCLCLQVFKFHCSITDAFSLYLLF